MLKLLALLALPSVSSFALTTARAALCGRALAVGSISRCASALRLSGGGIAFTDAEMETGIAMPTGYSFSQVDEVARIVMPVGEDVRAKDVTFELEKSTLTLGYGDELVIDTEPLWGRVVRDDCSWVIEDDEEGAGRCVVVELQKKDYGKWPFLLKSDYQPPNTEVTLRDVCQPD